MAYKEIPQKLWERLIHFVLESSVVNTVSNCIIDTYYVNISTTAWKTSESSGVRDKYLSLQRPSDISTLSVPTPLIFVYFAYLALLD
jgi:hypothetical protein